MPSKPSRGFLLIDKPAGKSSFAVIHALRKITGIKRIGHCGTLDPFATGLLICSLGAYTRLNSYLELRDKSYAAELVLGSGSSTGDTEGELSAAPAPDWSLWDARRLKAAALALTQLPTPIYSAVWINGKRSYALARAGNAIQPPDRPCRILDFEFTRLPQQDEPNPVIGYRCRVSKGTYIRSLSQWLALQLNTEGYTQSLQRTAIGDLELSSAIPLDQLTPDNWQDYIFPARRIFTSYPWQEISTASLDLMYEGQSLPSEGEDAPILMVYSPHRELAAVARRSQGRLYPIVNLK
ncbi:MAG: tRNA pseudouridine(55) synthase TruB [Candidatus Cloacimonadaceae bacterium]